MLNSYSYHQFNDVPTPTHQDFLKKTIQIKNKNIDELLQELKETKDIYQQYKSCYLNEQKKLKAKISDLTTQLSFHISQSQRLKQQNLKLKGQLQIQNDKQKKLLQNNYTTIKQLTSKLYQSQNKYKIIIIEHDKLKQKYNYLQDKYYTIQTKMNNQSLQLKIYEDQIKKIREQCLMKEKHIQEQNHRLKQHIRYYQHKKVEKNKVNLKLDQIQNKIKQTLRKI